MRNLLIVALSMMVAACATPGPRTTPDLHPQMVAELTQATPPGYTLQIDQVCRENGANMSPGTYDVQRIDFSFKNRHVTYHVSVDC